MKGREYWQRIWMATSGSIGGHRTSEVAGLELIDLRADREFDHDQVRQVLDEAQAHIQRAQGGFVELVTDHLHHVVATDSPLETASPMARALYTRFRASERRESFVFACRLVWAAAYIRAMRTRSWWRRSRYAQTALAEAQEEQLRFVHQFPDGAFWARIIRGDT